MNLIKNKYDPDNRFYCRHCVGSDEVKVNYTWKIPNSFSDDDFCTPHSNGSIPVDPV